VSDSAFERELCVVTDLARAVCLAPFLDEPADSHTKDEARKQPVAQKIKRDLDSALTDDVRADLVQLIQHFEDNRMTYRDAVVRWVDLLDDIAFYVEDKYGDGRGRLKQREVRAALYYIFKGFPGHTGLPTLPPWSRPIFLEIAVRATIDYLVTLDKPMSNRPELWGDASPVGSAPQSAWTRATATMGNWRQTASERIVAALIAFFLPPPTLSGRRQKDVDAILDEWAERNRLTGTQPFERAAAPVAASALWISTHGVQFRAAIDTVALAVYETAHLSRLHRHEQLEVVKEAVVMIFQDLGFTGPTCDTVVRFMVDLTGDATLHLFSKRGLVPPAASKLQQVCAGQARDR
jgi:hypothetical protein